MDWADFEKVRLESETVGLNQASDWRGEEIQLLTKNTVSLQRKKRQLNIQN